LKPAASGRTLDVMPAKHPPRTESLEALMAEHQAIEARLAELDRHLTLTSEEQLEHARLKKLKLLTKDQMARLGAPAG
jgi:hypothetical protein